MQLQDKLSADIQLSKKYTSIKELRSNDARLYDRIRKHGKVSQLCPHLKYQLTFWDKDSCFAVAAEYESRTDLKNGNGAVYQWLIRNSLLAEACKHMSLKKVAKWTKDAAFLCASKYSDSVQFSHEKGGCAMWLRSNKLYHVATAHFIVRDMTKKFKEIKGKSGIYLLYFKEDVVYIGKSETNIARRLERHKSIGDKEFDSIKAFVIDNMADIQLAELYLIHRHIPKYNKDSNSGDKPTLRIDNIDSIIIEQYHYMYDGESFVS